MEGEESGWSHLALVHRAQGLLLLVLSTFSGIVGKCAHLEFLNRPGLVCPGETLGDFPAEGSHRGEPPPDFLSNIFPPIPVIFTATEQSYHSHIPTHFPYLAPAIAKITPTILHSLRAVLLFYALLSLRCCVIRAIDNVFL